MTEDHLKSIAMFEEAYNKILAQGYFLMIYCNITDEQHGLNNLRPYVSIALTGFIPKDAGLKHPHEAHYKQVTHIIAHAQSLADIYTVGEVDSIVTPTVVSESEAQNRKIPLGTYYRLHLDFYYGVKR